MSSKMKVAFVVRSTFDSIRGGDSLQVMNTANELRKLGVEVDIKKANESIEYRNYDLLHLFNIIRPADHLKHIRKSKRPYVISTIYLDYSAFDKQARRGIQRHLFTLLGRNGAEYFKNMYRFLKKQDTMVSSAYLLGHKRALKEIISKATLLLPNSESEYQRLSKDYRIERDYHVIPNGINTSVFGELPNIERHEDLVLCVGQIYGLKNQHQLIEATRDMAIKLVLIGKAPPNHQAYYDYCKEIAHQNVEFYDFMPQEELILFYAQAKVHVLPSWFETTGLSSLEAGAMGCNLVVGAGGDTKDYFADYASFCQADDLQSIRSAIDHELRKNSNFNFRDKIWKQYTWEKAALETFVAYQKALDLG